MMINFISKSSEFIQLLICKKPRGFFCLNDMRRKIAKALQNQNPFRCQILVLRDYRFQFNIKVLSEGVMTINFISMSLEFIELLICKKPRGYYCLNEMRRKIAKVL